MAEWYCQNCKNFYPTSEAERDHDCSASDASPSEGADARVAVEGASAATARVHRWHICADTTIRCLDCDERTGLRYLCANCGEPCNMYASGHHNVGDGGWRCQRQEPNCSTASAPESEVETIEPDARVAERPWGGARFRGAGYGLILDAATGKKFGSIGLLDRANALANGVDPYVAGKHKAQRDVLDFHRALDIPIGETPAIRRPELRAELIREEAAETVDAILRGDLVEAIDGLCDLLCVSYGAAIEFGVDLAPYWDEVHRTNMAKVGGPVRADGKRLKPDGWTPPDIAGILAAALSDPESEAEAHEPFVGPQPTNPTGDPDYLKNLTELVNRTNGPESGGAE